jgi:hypothetical protein
MEDIARQPPAKGVHYALSRSRWSVLAVYAAASFMGALVWNILVRAPTSRLSRLPTSLRRLQSTRLPSSASSVARRQSTASQTCAVALTSRVRSNAYQAYYVYYLPGSVFALWVTERFGLRNSLLLGYVLQVLNLSLSVGGLRLASPHAAYWTVWLGQLIGSFGQPLFLNNTARCSLC